MSGRRTGTTNGADLLFDNFSVIAGSRGDVDRLRKLALELAVHLAGTIDGPPPNHVPLGDCGEWLGGLTPSKQRAEYWDDESIPWFSPKDMKRAELDDAQDHVTQRALEETSLNLLPPGSVLFVVRGMILAHTFPVAVTTRPATINQDMRAIIPKPEIYDRYLATVLRGSERRILELVKTSTHGTKKLDSPDLKQWIIPVPPLAEQRRIVEKVDRLMALCDELECRQRAELEERRRLRTASLAALEDAATAEEAERAWAHIAGEFGRLVDTAEDVAELRKAILQFAATGRLIDDGGVAGQQCGFPFWPAVRVDEILSEPMMNGRSVPSADNGFPVLRLSAIKDGWVNLLERKNGNWTEATAKPYLVSEGDFFVVRGNGSRQLVGRGGLVVDTPDPIAFPDTLIRLRFDKRRVLSEWISLIWRSSVVRSQTEEKAHTTSGIFKVSQKDIGEIRFSLPPLDEQRRIVEKVDSLMALCNTLEAGIRARDAALEAFAGAACRAVLDGPAPVAAPAAVAGRGHGQQRLPV